MSWDLLVIFSVNFNPLYMTKLQKGCGLFAAKFTILYNCYIIWTKMNGGIVKSNVSVDVLKRIVSLSCKGWNHLEGEAVMAEYLLLSFFLTPQQQQKGTLSLFNGGTPQLLRQCDCLSGRQHYSHQHLIAKRVASNQFHLFGAVNLNLDQLNTFYELLPKSNHRCWYYCF